MIKIMEAKETMAFDVESTGLDVDNDRIVEFGATIFGPGGVIITRGRALVNPGVVISDEAKAVHGIGNERVAACPPFADLLPRIAVKFDNCDLLTCYNGLHYDIPMINAEAARAGSDWRVPRDKVIDLKVFVDWSHRGDRPRKLEIIASKYGIRPQAGAAHSAAVDTQMTGELLMAMIAKGTIPETVDECLREQSRILAIVDAEFRDWGPWIYRCRTTQRLRMGAGKHCGQFLADVPKSFLSWIIGNIGDLPATARTVIEAARDGKVKDEVQRTMIETETKEESANEMVWGDQQ